MKTKFTKIVNCSDRRCDVDFIKQLAENGLNVVRMNSAHIQREGFQRIVNNVRAVSDRIGILMDTKGPKSEQRLMSTTKTCRSLPETRSV